MSRVIVLDENNMSVGELQAVCEIGWTLNGHPSVSGGGSSQIRLSDVAAASPWLEIGRMVVILPTDLPAYIGVIDTPWGAVTPASMTVYSAEYLLHIRAAESAVKYTGNVEKILRAIVEVANGLEEMYLRLGDVYEIDRTYREETLDARPLWEQVQALGLRAATEMVFRPQKNASNGRWYVYMDIGKDLGNRTDYLLSDGQSGNMRVVGAEVRGEIINRLVGISSQSTDASRLQTDPMIDETSKRKYRLRNRTVQFRDVVDRNTLDKNTLNALEATAYPYLELTVEVANRNNAFRYLRPGNRLMVQAAKIWLPGGIQGWRGEARITRMFYQEQNNTVQMVLIGSMQ